MIPIKIAQMANALSGGTLMVCGWDSGEDMSANDISISRPWGSLYAKEAGRITKIFARFPTPNTADRVKVLCYAHGGVNPTGLLWATEYTNLTSAGGVLEMNMPLAGIENTDAAGSYWFIITCRDTYSSQYGYVAGATGIKMIAGQDLASVDAPAPAWPAGENTFYDDIATCVWCEYLG